MSSIWHLPREDTPSVLSNRVYSVRHLNKLESQRLGSQIHHLNVEEAQTTSLISQEQKALRRELTQIREVKGNPPVGIERRKLLQQMSNKESQTCRHHLSVETQEVQSRFRSLSTGHAPLQRPQLPPLNARQRSKSTTCPPLCSRREELSGPAFRRKESESVQDINNNIPQKGVSGPTRNDKIRLKSLSTGNRPQISAWAGGKKDGIQEVRKDDFAAVQNWQNQNHINLETKINPNPAWGKEGSRKEKRFSGNSSKAPYVSDQDLQTQGAVKNASTKLALTRRGRSYSTGRAPIISEGKVVGLCGKTTTVSQYAKLESQRRKSCGTSSSLKVFVKDDRQDAPKENTNQKRQPMQSIPMLLTGRKRSMSTNCPPVSLEGMVVDNDNKNKQLNFKMNTDGKQRNS